MLQKRGVQRACWGGTPVNGKGSKQDRATRPVCGSSVSVRQRWSVRGIPHWMEMAGPLTMLGSAIAWGHPKQSLATCIAEADLEAVSWPDSAQLGSESSFEGGDLHPPPPPTVYSQHSNQGDAIKPKSRPVTPLPQTSKGISHWPLGAYKTCPTCSLSELSSLLLADLTESH